MWEGSYVNPAKKGNTLFAFISNYNQRNTENSDACVLLAEFNQRMERQRKCCHMSSMTCEVAWRLTLGMGNPNPIENGFGFDPIIGVPVINGTAIKGLCRHAAKEFNHDADESELTRLFGPETIEHGIADPSTGDILFFDALPALWPRLCVDMQRLAWVKYAAAGGNGEKRSWQRMKPSCVNCRNRRLMVKNSSV